MSSIAVRTNQPYKYPVRKLKQGNALVNKNGFHKVVRKQEYNDNLIGNNTIYYKTTMGNYENDNKMNYRLPVGKDVSMNSRSVWEAIQYKNLPYYNELRGLQSGYDKPIPETTKYNRLNIDFGVDNPPHKISMGIKVVNRQLSDNELTNEEHAYDKIDGNLIGTELNDINRQSTSRAILARQDIHDPLVVKAVDRYVNEVPDTQACYVNNPNNRPNKVVIGK